MFSYLSWTLSSFGKFWWRVELAGCHILVDVRGQQARALESFFGHSRATFLVTSHFSQCFNLLEKVDKNCSFSEFYYQTPKDKRKHVTFLWTWNRIGAITTKKKSIMLSIPKFNLMLLSLIFLCNNLLAWQVWSTGKSCRYS